MEQKGNLYWINALKAICMILVFFYHSECYCNIGFEYIDRFYSPFFVNAFFVVSGYLLFRKQLSVPLVEQNLKVYVNGGGRVLLENIVFKLIIPSVLFSALFFFPKFFLRGIVPDYIQFAKQTVLGGATWFTCALSVAELLLLIVLMTRRKSISPYILYGMILSICAYFLYKNKIVFFNDPYLPWYYKSALSAVLLMAIGGFYWQYENIIDRILNKWFILTYVMFFLLYVFSKKSIGNFHIHSGSLTPASICVIILTVYCFIRFCKILPENRFLNYWGKHSIGLYFFCGPIPSTMAIILEKVVGYHNSFTVIAVFLISLIMAIFVCFLLNKYTPFVFDFRGINKK